jgi:hypothetical protein
MYRKMRGHKNIFSSAFENIVGPEKINCFALNVFHYPKLLFTNQFLKIHLKRKISFID